MADLPMAFATAEEPAGVRVASADTITRVHTGTAAGAETGTLMHAHHDHKHVVDLPCLAGNRLVASLAHAH